ncbi:MAG: polymer-forming cytoskeletal protein [Bacillota bacterium]
MFGKQKITVSQKIETLIGKETVLSGSLQSKGSIRIDGSFKGEITSRSDVIIGEDGLVQARIDCINVILAGRVEGNIKTEGKLDIRSTGVLVGDAEVGSLAVEDGAVLTGNCKMKIREDKRVHTENKGEHVNHEIHEHGEKQNREIIEINEKKEDGTGGKDNAARDKAVAERSRGKNR